METGYAALCWTGCIASEPDAIAQFIAAHAPDAVRIGLEAGATSTWLWTELNKRGLPVICIDARHAKAALKMQINKSDRNDAAGIARIMQCGWYKEVRVKALDGHAIRALLSSRSLLVGLKRDLENQITGLLKNFGLVIGRAKMNTFTAKALELIDGKPGLAAAIEPLLKAREALARQIEALDRKLLRLARSEPQVRRFMTVPGVGPHHSALLPRDHRRSGALQEIAQCGRLCGADHAAIRIGRNGRHRPHIQMGR
jgi:transposase